MGDHVYEETTKRAYTISGGDSETNISNKLDHNSTQFLVTVNSRFKPAKKLIYLKRATTILLVLFFLAFGGLIAIVILYMKTIHLNSSYLCLSKECIRSAANFKFSMNLSKDPCENFYEFCCGQWTEEHPNHGWYPTYSTFETLTEKIVFESMKVLKDEAKEGSEPYSVSQAKWLYQSCMATDIIDELGLKPLYEILTMVHLPIIPTFFNKSVDQKKIDFDWTKTEIFLKIVLAMDVFIGFNVEPNMYKRNENAIHLGVLVHICPLPAPFKDKTKHRRNKKKGDKHEELRMKIQSEMVKVVLKDILEDNNCSNVENSELQIAADLITNMTLFIDDLNENYTLLQESGYLVDEKFSFKEFETLMENNMEIPLEVNFWVNYITNIFRWHSNVTIDAQTDYLYIRETESEYLWQILNYIQQQPPIYIELYMWWSAVYAIISNTSWTITDILLKVALSYYESDPDIFVKSRSLDCCELVNQYMAWPVSYAIADKTFPNKTKPKVEKIIEEIKEVFVEYVKNLKWMDDITKQATLEKSKEMLSFVGYPDWLFKDGALDRKHSGLEINETTYLKNMVNIIMQYTEETLTSLRLENPRDWTTEPIIVNAFNSFSDNAINVPMAILNYPLYDLGLDVLNYGSIGTILGHELMHGFDNSGRKYDKFGNYIQFWSNQTINAFENMTECFIKQYDNYTIDGVNTHVKGKVTLSENLADNGGLNQAYTAYKKHISRYGDDLKLPGFEHYSSFQMFFIAYGSIWCESSSVKELTNQLEHDEHCPNSVRVIGTLQNSEEFAEVFHCSETSYMNTRKRCKIW